VQKWDSRSKWVEKEDSRFELDPKRGQLVKLAQNLTVGQNWSKNGTVLSNWI